MEPIRILQYGLSSSLAGIENVIMDLYRNIDRERVQFDFLMMNDEDPYFKDEILEMGGKIYKEIYLRGKNPIRGTFWNYRFFKRHTEFSAIHCNVSSVLSIDRILTPYVCKNIQQRIVHIHNAGEGKEDKHTQKKIEEIRKQLPQIATDMIATSEFAGKYNFGNVLFDVIPNCIEVQKYQFDSSVRKEIRKRYDIESKKVIGVVGVLRYQKNHEMLLRIFKEILNKDDEYVLMIVGAGFLEKELQQQAISLEINDNVIWCGKQENPTPFYCAMDLFVMPSRYEGFGLVYMEAQCCGLPCVGSAETVPYEVGVTDLMKFVSLNDSPALWANQILNIPILDERERMKRSKTFKDYHCDIKDYANKIEKLYLKNKECEKLV